MKHGKVIFLNGTSSSGKSTIAKGLQQYLGEPYLHVSVDGFLHQLPDAYLTDNRYLAGAIPMLLTGFDASSAAIARAGINVIIDNVLQEPSWVLPCIKAFEGLQVVFVGVRCPLEVLESREKARGDRQVGMACYQYDRVHAHKRYDVEVDTSEMTIEECVETIRQYVDSDTQPTAFDKLRSRAHDCEQRLPAESEDGAAES